MVVWEGTPHYHQIRVQPFEMWGRVACHSWANFNYLFIILLLNKIVILFLVIFYMGG